MDAEQREAADPIEARAIGQLLEETRHHGDRDAHLVELAGDRQNLVV